MRLHVSTADLPERSRFDAWTDMVHGMIGVGAEPPDDTERPFEARIAMRASLPLLYVNLQGVSFPVRRGTADIGRRRWDCVFLYREGSAGAWFDHGGREFTTRTNDLVLADADVPFRSRPADGYQHQLWLVPKALIGPYLPAGSGPTLLRFKPADPTTALLETYLGALTRNWDGFDGPTMGAVADTLSRLVGIAAGQAAAEHPEAMRQGRLVQAKRYIAAHLASPELGPATVAAALGISVRALHLLFEPGGTSFARYVLQQRLRECRAALLADPGRPVIDIAFAWGFGSLSTFYRAFQAAFEVSPGDARAMAGAARAERLVRAG